MKYFYFSTLFFVVCFLFTMFLGCEDTITNNNGNTKIIFPSTNISYRKHVQPLFNVSCAFSDCHDKQYPGRNFDLTSYSGLMYTPGIVVDSFPDLSKLIQSVEGELIPRMPLNRDTLNSNQLKGLRQWVLEGAKNN